MTINFYGWRSGEGTIIDCISLDCTVNCWNENACVETFCNNCELVYLHSTSIDVQNIHHIGKISITIGTSMKYIDVFASAEDDCNADDAMTFDNLQEHYDGEAISSTSIICCRGQHSCAGTTSIFTSE